MILEAFPAEIIGLKSINSTIEDNTIKEPEGNYDPIAWEKYWESAHYSFKAFLPDSL